MLLHNLAVRISIYDQYADGAGPVLCLGGGTPHKPAILSETGHVIHEASAYASYLLKHVSSMSSSATNVPAVVALVIHESTTVKGNCNLIYSYMQHNVSSHPLMPDCLLALKESDMSASRAFLKTPFPDPVLCFS